MFWQQGGRRRPRHEQVLGWVAMGKTPIARQAGSRVRGDGCADGCTPQCAPRARCEQAVWLFWRRQAHFNVCLQVRHRDALCCCPAARPGIRCSACRLTLHLMSHVRHDATQHATIRRGLRCSTWRRRNRCSGEPIGRSTDCHSCATWQVASRRQLYRASSRTSQGCLRNGIRVSLFALLATYKNATITRAAVGCHVAGCFGRAAVPGGCARQCHE